jgi:hypothetical protein
MNDIPDLLSPPDVFARAFQRMVNRILWERSRAQWSR